jgi:hypothetical protein
MDCEDVNLIELVLFGVHWPAYFLILGFHDMKFLYDLQNYEHVPCG